MTTRTGLAISGWGAGAVDAARLGRAADGSVRAVRRRELPGFRVRGGLRSIVAAAAVVAVWALLWAVFAMGVVVPAAQIHGLGAPPAAARAVGL